MSIFAELTKDYALLSTGTELSPVMRRALNERISRAFKTLAEAVDAMNPADTTVVSNPPTQAEVQAINDRLVATRQILAS